jgi:predicted nucleic acid-binding protein
VIILDTNVISEAMRGDQADPAVLTWIRALPQPPVTTVINRVEILAGLALLPDGRRADQLRHRAASVLGGMGVCLPLTDACADPYAEMFAARTALGRPIGGFDALIAAIARASGASIATRDLAGFDGLGLDLIDPWTA